MPTVSSSKRLIEHYNVLHIPTKINKDIRIEVDADNDGAVEIIHSIELHQSDLSNGNLTIIDLSEFIEEFDLWDKVITKIDWRESYYQKKFSC